MTIQKHQAMMLDVERLTPSRKRAEKINTKPLKLWLTRSIKLMINYHFRNDIIQQMMQSTSLTTSNPILEEINFQSEYEWKFHH